MPFFTPFVLIKERKMMLAIAYNCAAETLKNPKSAKILSGPKAGINTAVNFAKATATAAITPDCMTVKTVQPYKKEVKFPYALWI